MNHVPVFPLSTPLLPGCTLPLQIFEPRYLNMVSRCMRENQGLVITMLYEGSEVQSKPGQPARFFEIGTYGHITDFSQMENGLLAITVSGEKRVSLGDIHQQSDGLWLATIEILPEREQPDQHEFEALRDLLKKLLQHELMAHMRNVVNLDQPVSVMNYLIMLLPLPVRQKQALLETDSLSLRWNNLVEVIALMEEKANR